MSSPPCLREGPLECRRTWARWASEKGFSSERDKGEKGFSSEQDKGEKGEQRTEPQQRPALADRAAR